MHTGATAFLVAAFLLSIYLNAFVFNPGAQAGAGILLGTLAGAFLALPAWLAGILAVRLDRGRRRR